MILLKIGTKQKKKVYDSKCLKLPKSSRTAKKKFALLKKSRINKSLLLIKVRAVHKIF